ncbi:hypothetical protein V6S02_04820 [Microbacterium sp. CCNWLW134]|uniref:hypothetical protein n=1 Tax=Microbacterium sp. CCNWLW134 TaxID=3122064 RepID=UPI00300FD420
MSDTTPLRHLLEPGEYRVQWTIPSRERGEITLEEGLVRGHLLNGQWSCRQLAVLCDRCVTRHPRPERA